MIDIRLPKKRSATRNGEIARLPKPIRDDLGRRIENGEPSKPNQA
jgi:hypothetical protein